MPRLGQAHDTAVVQLHRRIHGVGAQRFRVAHGDGLAHVCRFLHLGAVGVVVHGIGVGGAVEQHRAVRIDERVARQSAELLFQRGSVLGRRSGVQIARRILGTGRKLGFSVVLVRQVVDGGHRHGQRNDDGQREREHARENLAGQALNLEMRRAHARAHEEGLMQ